MAPPDTLRPIAVPDSEPLDVEAPTTMQPDAALRSIKLIHTVVWALFASCILLIPILSYLDHVSAAALLVGLVLVEVVVLVLNGLRCPLTTVASRYTDDRRDNFDIFLPEWVARHNKSIFGLLYLFGSFYTLARWMAWLD